MPEIFERFTGVFESVPGWFQTPAAAVWDCLLSFQAEEGIRGDLMEIGVWQGRSAGLMGLHKAPDETFLLVDSVFEPPAVKSNLRRFGLEPDASYRLIREPSDNLRRHGHLEGGRGRYRWIHIDGDHTGPAVVRDLDVAHRVLSPEGLVTLDDVFSWQYPQITQILFETLRRHPRRFALVLVGYDKAYLARPGAARRYLDFCHDRLVDELERRNVQSTLARTDVPDGLGGFGVGPRLEGRRHRGPDADLDRIVY